MLAKHRYVRATSDLILRYGQGDQLLMRNPSGSEYTCSSIEAIGVDTTNEDFAFIKMAWSAVRTLSINPNMTIHHWVRVPDEKNCTELFAVVLSNLILVDQSANQTTFLEEPTGEFMTFLKARSGLYLPPTHLVDRSICQLLCRTQH
jgi:hypothetical protein